jgi:hypothetical protein
MTALSKNISKEQGFDSWVLFELVLKEDSLLHGSHQEFQQQKNVWSHLIVGWFRFYILWKNRSAEQPIAGVQPELIPFFDSSLQMGAFQR